MKKKKIAAGALCRLTNEQFYGGGDPLTLWTDVEFIDDVEFDKDDVFFVTNETFSEQGDECLNVVKRFAHQTRLDKHRDDIDYRFVVSHSVQGWIEEYNIIVLQG